MAKQVIIFMFFTALLGIGCLHFTDNVIPAFGIAAAAALGACFALRNYLRNFSFSTVLLVSVFVFIIIIPLAGKKEDESLEKRTLAKFPEFNLHNVWEFFFGFRDYFSDHFAYRNLAVGTVNKIGFIVFNISPMPDHVVIGKDQWLFTSNKGFLQLTSVPFTQAQLDTVHTNIRIITKWFNEKNIKYYLMLVPSKARVYPEMMPPLLIKQGSFARMNQLNDMFRADTAVRLIECTQTLIDGKKVRPTFLRTDTHWNQYGAFLAYLKVMERMKKDFPQIRAMQMEEFTLDSDIIDGGDLQQLMGFDDQITTPTYFFDRKSGSKPVITESKLAGYPECYKYSVEAMPERVNGLRLFVVRDSYTEYLKNFLSPSFDHVEMAWMPQIPLPPLMKSSPDIVLHEVAELFIEGLLRIPPEIKNDTAFMQKNFPGFHPLR